MFPLRTGSQALDLIAGFTAFVSFIFMLPMTARERREEEREICKEEREAEAHAFKKEEHAFNMRRMAREELQREGGGRQSSTGTLDRIPSPVPNLP